MLPGIQIPSLKNARKTTDFSRADIAVTRLNGGLHTMSKARATEAAPSTSCIMCHPPAVRTSLAPFVPLDVLVTFNRTVDAAPHNSFLRSSAYLDSFGIMFLEEILCRSLQVILFPGSFDLTAIAELSRVIDVRLSLPTKRL